MNKLDKMFDKLNRDFWNGRLPKYKVKIGDHPTQVQGRLQGYCDSKAKIIWLQTTKAELRKTLLHEMCHIGCNYHGKKFMKRLQCLADLGESWAAQEITIYDEFTYNQQLANARTRLTDLAFEVGDLSADDVIKYIADDFGVSPDEMLRRAPWIPLAWEKDCKAMARLAALRSKN